MTAPVHSRIGRLQAISPRASAAVVIAMDVMPADTPPEGMFKYDSVTHRPMFWNAQGWVFLAVESGGIYAIITEGFGSFGKSSWVITDGFGNF